MARVSITINGYAYDIACSDGEEDHIRNLAETLDGKVAELVGAIGQAGEARLLAMAGLLLADELAEAKAQAEDAANESQRLAAELAASAEAGSGNGAGNEAPSPGIDAERLSGVLENLAERIETIAHQVEQS